MIEKNKRYRIKKAMDDFHSLRNLNDDNYDILYNAGLLDEELDITFISFRERSTGDKTIFNEPYGIIRDLKANKHWFLREDIDMAFKKLLDEEDYLYYKSLNNVDLWEDISTHKGKKHAGLNFKAFSYHHYLTDDDPRDVIKGAVITAKFIFFYNGDAYKLAIDVANKLKVRKERKAYNEKITNDIKKQ